jgi:cytochrome c peroxidase
VSIVGSSAREVTLLRGIPTTMNTGPLDPVLMYDGRAPNLAEQARNAVLDHAESTDVSPDELNAMAEFQHTLFNRDNLRTFAERGTIPELPEGRTESEKRGRLFFTNDNPANGDPPQGRCVHCHSGPMLNETSPGLEILTGAAVPAGSRFFDVHVSDFNVLGNPVYRFRFTNPDGSTTDVASPDPGRALITGVAADTNKFKIPTVWGAVDTAPYFHDNSAGSVEELLERYDQYFNVNGFDLTDQDKIDIANYMKLL